MIGIEIFSFFGKIVTNAADAEQDIKGVTNTAKDSEGKLTKVFANIGKAIVAAFSVKAIVDFGKKLIESSANIQAMEAQFDQVFKDDNAQAVEGIAKQVDDLGIHADRLTVSWNKFGGQVKGAGMDGEQALAAVDKATRLAADSAAFYDTSLENSSASLASFMKGNFEAGDAIGVFTNAKQMDVKSNEMYGKSWVDLTEAERQWLLLDTVEKTYEMNGAMGQAQRESGAYENTIGNLKATFERFYSVVGAPVLESFLVAVQKVTDKVVVLTEKIQNGEGIFGKFGDAVNWVKENQEILIPILGGVTAAVAAQLIINTVKAGYTAFKTATEGTTAAQVILNAVMNANPFGVAAIAIGVLVTAGVALYKNWDTVSAKAIEIKNNITGAWDNLKIKTVEAWNNIKTDVTETVTGLVDDALQWGNDLVTGFWNGITDRAGWLKDKVYGFVEGIGKTITGFFGIESPSKLMALYGRYIDEGLAKGIEDNANKPKSSMDSVAESISNAFKKVGDFVTNTSNVIQKEFELWKLQNEDLQGSSKELEMQLEAQQEQHELLIEQIRITETALSDIVTKYGEGSTEALNYKNQLLDLQIAQAKLANEINSTNEALSEQINLAAKRVTSYNSLSDSEKSSRQSEYKKEKNNFYEANRDEISAISKRQNVDIGVAQDMLRENILSGIPKYAKGTNFHQGGLAWVGEEGPELIEPPRGSKVYTNQESKNMINQRPIEVHLHIGNYIGDDYSLKQLERKLKSIRILENDRLGVELA